MIKILIADDHSLIREGLKKIIESFIDLSVVSECENGDQVLNFIRENQIDILLIDISMPKRNGLEVIKILQIEKPALPILVLSIHPEIQYARRVLKLGALGYITKDKAPDELVSAIRKVALGKRYISSSLAEQLYRELDESKGQPSYKRLSDREFAVLIKIVSGMAIKNIADELNLSSKTISTYKHRIYDKLQLTSEAEMTRYAIENKLIE